MWLGKVNWRRNALKPVGSPAKASGGSLRTLDRCLETHQTNTPPPEAVIADEYVLR